MRCGDAKRSLCQQHVHRRVKEKNDSPPFKDEKLIARTRQRVSASLQGVIRVVNVKCVCKHTRRRRQKAHFALALCAADANCTRALEC